MLREILLFELRQAFRKTSTYVYFFILFAITFLSGLAASKIFDTVRSDSNIILNSEYTVAGIVLSFSNGIFLLFFCSILISIAGTSIQKDFQYNTHPLFFTKPITKEGYFFGRLFGSLLACVIVFSGLVLGYYGGTLFGEGLPVMGPFELMNFLSPFLIFIIPNILFFGLLLFSVTTYTRSTMTAYLVVILLFVFQIVASLLSQKLEYKFIAAIIDPSGSGALENLTQYWSPAEKNRNSIPLTGVLLYNRMLWLGIAVLIGAASYWGFSFSQFQNPVTWFRRKKADAGAYRGVMHSLSDLPKVTIQNDERFAWKQIAILGKMEAAKIISSVFYIVISILTVGITIAIVVFENMLDTSATYPVTYKIVGMVTGSPEFFAVIFVVFSSGMVLWRERDARLDELVGVTPPGNGVFFFSKLSGMFMAISLLYLVSMLTGIGIQLAYGFFDIDPSQYLVALLVSMAEVIVFMVLALAVQSFVSNKYLGYFITLLPLMILPIIFTILEWNNPLADFNSTGGGRPYSDMNGYGGKFIQWPFYRIYWYGISAFLCLLAVLLYPRGKEKSLKSRWNLSSYFYDGKYKLKIALSLVVALIAGAFILYQEYVVVPYTKPKDSEKEVAEYEKKYKKYKGIPQPRITAVRLEVDLFTRSKEMNAKGRYRLKNKTATPVDLLYIDYPGGKKSSFQFSRLTPDRSHKVINSDSVNGVRIIRLEQPLAPGDSLNFDFEFYYAPHSFYHASSSMIMGNGTFINNDIFPSIGYNENSELSENTARVEYGLPPRPRLAKVDDSVALMNNYISSDADWIDFEAIVSTDEGQTAIAPGYLQKQWKKDGRHYFHYKMDSPMLNFYSFLSADYEIRRDKWKDVNIEIFYHKGHEYNIDRMIRSIKRSFDYYTANFGPYQHRQARIIEFPRYASFAQSFPNTIPYSEAIGFIQKVDDDPEKIDLPFYVTAHEVAHQWWAHQVIGGNVQGKELMSETLCQYSALMVMEKEYGKEAMKKFLKEEMDNYLQSRAFESKGELPLMLVEQQQYIYYNKGSIVMYALRDFIGEEKLNKAIRAFLEKTKFSGPPYTNSLEFVSFIRQETPDSLRYLITDLFEKITIYENYVASLDYKQLQDKTYKVTLRVGSAKFYSDSLGNRSKAAVNDYMEIGIFANDTIKGKSKEQVLLMQRVKMDEPEKTFEFIVKRKPSSAGIDPYLKLVDRNPGNNSSEFGKKPKIPDLDPDKEVVIPGLDVLVE